VRIVLVRRDLDPEGVAVLRGVLAARAVRDEEDRAPFVMRRTEAGPAPRISRSARSLNAGASMSRLPRARSKTMYWRSSSRGSYSSKIHERSW